MLKKFLAAWIIFLAVTLSGCGNEKISAPKEFLNVSYDPTRELYAEYNENFLAYWAENFGGEKIILNQSHGGSGKQTRAVIDGQLDADVVTLALAYDVTEIKNAGLIRGGWRKNFPDNSSPYTSTIVFLVRKGNPKNIRDWDDLVRDDVKNVTPNPKTSGGAKWNYLAAWEFARRKFDGDENKIRDFITKLYENAAPLDDGARGSTMRFIQRGEGDVLIAWENEALRSMKDLPNDYEIVTPSLSILAEPSVAIVDKNVDAKGTRKIAVEYLNRLYSPEGQEIAAKNFYRPRDEKILSKYADVFKRLELFTIDEAFGGWVKAHNDHFSDGATFDQIYTQ
ncbi:MAG: sulfate ABC transporter substrate-binding protein [Selenomonadaceae bacterium]|nr:sulfate ABC transporter substrate-binding protein [Selenomonadaceae bacterium]